MSKKKERRNPQVDHPQHYGGADNPYETIKVIGAWLGNDAVIKFCLGNTLKYISRAGKKATAPIAEDLEKAQWYLKYATKLTRNQEWLKKQELNNDEANKPTPDNGDATDKEDDEFVRPHWTWPRR